VDQTQSLCASHELQRALYYRRVNHLRTQAHHSQTFFLRLVVGGNDSFCAFNLPWLWGERFVNDWNLKGMHAAHALEAESAGVAGPGSQAVERSHIAKDGINGLH